MSESAITGGESRRHWTARPLFFLRPALRHKDDLARRSAPFERAVRVAGAFERKTGPDRDFEFVARGEIEQLRKPVLQARRGQETRQRETGQRLILEDDADQLRHTNLEALNVERAIDDKFAVRRQRSQASL